MLLSREWLNLDPLPEHSDLVVVPPSKGGGYRDLIRLGVGAAVGFLLLIGWMTIRQLTEGGQEPSGQEMIILVGLQLVLIFGLPTLLARNGRATLVGLLRPLPPRQWRGYSWSWLILILLGIGLGLSFVLSELSSSIIQALSLEGIFSLEDSVAQQVEEMLLGADAGTIVLALFSLCIAPGVCEELFFRGVVDRALQQEMPQRPWLSLWLSSAIFSLLHFSAVGFLSRMALGGLLAYTYRKTNRIYMPMLLHALNNLIALLWVFVPFD